MATMTLKQFQTYLKQQPAQIQSAVIRGVRSAAQRGVGIIVQEIDNAQPFPAVNTGAMRQSAHAENTPMGARVQVDAPWAAISNYGSRPHRPPLAPIVQWVVRKFGIAEADAYPIAKAVCDKIAAEGTAPRHWFEKAMKRIEEIVDQEVQHELNAIGASTT